MTLAATVPTGELDLRRPVLLTVRPAPRREPPFDDELPRSVRTASAYDQPLPFPRRTRSSTAARPGYDKDLPDPSLWTRRLLIGLTETAAGKRSPQQLADFLTPSIANGISAEMRRTEAMGRGHWLRGASIGSIRVMQPRSGVAEVCATMSVGSRVRAVALRIERRHSQWRCTRIVLG
jgi:hypothetical protein